MSVRGTKRASGVRGEEAGASKRRRTETEDSLWQLRSVSDLKMSSIYNRGVSEAPAELFRKDLISAMKLPDSEPLTPSGYWVITDTWKQDWERGVQVPVNPDSLPTPKVNIIENPQPPNFHEFKLPRDKYIHLNRDAGYNPEQHQITTVMSRAESACTYDLDAVDQAWLKLANAERARAGVQPLTEDQLERVIEELEVRCWDKIQSIMKSEEGLGIEYDENVICDVCRSPDSEDGNEMVFCDACNICVHQACYGITVIPSGQWLCRPCGDGVRPTCVLCPNLGGAMKCTPSGHKWAHVSCVLWIPEVSIGCAEKMEPITKISAIPPSRWSLVCVLCRERKGACIQCSVKTCKTAYHVTCAFKHGLEMRAIIEDETAEDGVKLRSYCQKHSVNSKKDKGSGSEDEEVKKKRRKDTMTSEEKSQARAARLQEIEGEFDRHVSVKDISTHVMDVDQDAINLVYNYWKVKRRSGHNRPLLPPKSDETDLLTHRQEQADLDKMKMFVQLRQDLERVRNLCYMVSRREKLSRSFFRIREQTFHKQISVLSADAGITGPDLSAIIEANHGPSIYDKLYSHADAPDQQNDLDELLSRIAGPCSSDDKKTDLNGLVKGTKGNQYRRPYVNGSSRRSGSMYSGMSSEESAPEISRTTTKFRGISTDEDSPKKKALSAKKKISPKGKGKKSPKKVGRKRAPQSKALIDSSSEDESVQKPQKDWSKSLTLQKMENEMTAVKGGVDSDSDELMPIISTARNTTKYLDIYSDSSENDTKAELFSDKSPNATNDSQTLPRTKAAMKEFVPTQPAAKSEKPEPKKRGRKPSSHKEKKTKDLDNEAKNKENIKFIKSKDNPTDLIVPQRQAAKKASENMRTTTVRPKDESTSDRHTSGDDTKPKPKIKSKRDSKDSKEKDPVKTEIKRKMSSDVEKETIAYVPQRQAAKKAAAHIKSGLGSKLPAVETSEDKKKEVDKAEPIKKSPKKEVEKSVKELSSSSSSNSSSSSYSSSSSSEDEAVEKPGAKPMAKAREIKPATRPVSVTSPTGPRPTVDLPFLDRVSRPLSSTSGSSDSESSKGTKRSGSISPPPKRPRRRRHKREEATNKAADKKLKTSEPRPETGVPSPSAQGLEPGRTDARAAARARTRSVTASGNMSDSSELRPGEPSREGSELAVDANRTDQESGKPSLLPTPEREANKAVNSIKSDSPRTKKHSESVDNKTNRHSVLTDDKIKADRNIVKHSPQKGSEQKHKTPPSRRASVKETPDVVSPNKQPASDIKNTSPNKKLSIDMIPTENKLKENDKHWLPKGPSPSRQPPPVEKPGGHEKYMTEDKDSDFADKSSIKMIAKIQANLNENTMIKSPKTPMDARMMGMDPMDFEHPITKKRKRTESDKKYMNQEVHVQGVEISKRAKIPSTINPYPKRSIFSPQPKENELFELENMISVDDGFNNDDVMKPFASFPDSFFFKEDSKEQGVQETRNLVDRLRMQYKKVSVDDPTNDQDMDEDTQADSIANEKEATLKESSDTTQSDKVDYTISNNHAPSNDRRDVLSEGESRDIQLSDLQGVPEPYEHSMTYSEDQRIQQELMNDTERDNVSKQSDDSQSLSVVDHSIHSNDQESVTADHSNYDNNNSLIHSDCATISSPYVSQDSKWHESKITHRRSSASSSDSDASVSSQRPTIKPIPGSVHPQAMEPYPPMPAYSCSIEPPMPLNQYSNYPPDSPFISSMSALPMFSSATTMPLPSPGGALFPTVMPIPYSSSPLVTNLSKPSFPTLGAAFTSSSQNIALTTAMIAPSTPKPSDSPRDDHDTTGSDKFSVDVVSSPSIDSYNENNTRSVPSKNDNSSETMSNFQSQHAKSPPKPTNKSITKFAGKSPKSPRFSPKQAESTKGSNKRSSSKSNRSQRGRGRAKSRTGTSHPHNIDFMGNSIQSKLVGTPYDFDDEIANDGVDLKSLRERRKSIDNSDRKSEASFKDASQSPHVASPQSKRSTPAIDNKESKHASPVPEATTLRSPVKSSSERSQTFPPVVQPVLPGPVDMRTYQPFESAAPATTPATGLHSHLLAFASGTADQQLAEIDEEVEKQLHSALMASKPEETPVQPIEIKDTTPPITTPQLPRVSLSDSRNQLKVKIKGPFLDANYSSSVSHVAPQPTAPVVDRGPSTLNATNPSASSAMGGNLRRMRKKELLRQYWNQDMNMDEPINPNVPSSAPQAAAPQPYVRSVITIPKAVASMTSIPTREDYKIFDTTVEKKKRKTSGIAREVGNLGISMNDGTDHSDEGRYSYNVSAQLSNKRRGRVNNKPNKVPISSPVAPKLRIKIGAKFVQPVETEEPISDYQLRPPKKRLASIQTPSIEDLRRESMKYRKMVMADFEHDEVKKHKPNKSEKRKKKKDKKSEKIQVVKSDSDSATKLIIKIKRTKEEEARDAALGVGSANAAVSEPPVDPFEYDPSAPDPLAIDPPTHPGSTTGLRNIRTAKVTPIRLKLARSAEGSGYVMQGDAAAEPKQLTNCQVR